MAATRALRRYQELAVGQTGLWPLLRYEALTGLLGPLPGAAGIALRSAFYRRILGEAGRGVTIGRSVTLRGPGRIHLEAGVALDDYVQLATRETSSSLRVGAGTLLARGTIIHARGGTVEIGPESSLGTHCRLGTTGHLRIGRYALLAAGCFIGGEDHPVDDPSTPMVKTSVISKGGVTIGDDVWMGFRATVLDGVTVGAGAVIGAHALVTDDIPPGAIAVGAPARVVRYREAVEPSTEPVKARER